MVSQYFIIDYNKAMTNKLSHPELTEWINTMGVAQLFNSQDLQSGKTVAVLLQAIDRGNKVQLQQGGTAINRISNWNTIAERVRSLGIKISQEDKNKIINGNHQIVFKVISKLKEVHQKSSKETQINLKEFDTRKDLAQANSLLELMLLAIIKHFALNPKEALSLLSNDSKYLAHILAKGLKNDFKPIQNFINELTKHLPKITTFFKNKQNQIFFIRSVKPALISKSQAVSELTLNLINNYLNIYETSIKTQLLKQHFISTLMLIIRRHPHLIDVVLINILRAADYSNDILQEIVINSNKNQLTSILISLWNIYKDKKDSQKLIQSEAFQKLITHLNSSLKDPELALGSITAFLEIATSHFSLISSTSSDDLLSAFRQMNFIRQSDNLVYIHVCCSLMKLAGEQKHNIAPLIFKFLTSKLISTLNTEYESILLNIKEVIQEIPSIPTLPILEALTQRAELKITQLQLETFARILQLGAQPKSAVAIFNIISRSLVQDVGLGLQIGNMLCQVILNFKQQQIIIDMTSKLIKVCLAIYYANSKKLSERRKPMSYKNKLDDEQATSKLKNIQIQNFLRKVIQINEKEINGNIQPLICFSYIQIKTLNRDHTQKLEVGIEKIVQLFGNLNELMNKYKAEMEDSEIITGNQSKIKQASQLKGNKSFAQVQQELDYTTLPKRVKSIHPNSLSLAGVKPDAYSGLQKFSKRHESKVLMQQSLRYQALKIEQDRQQLKKVYAKKMMVDKGFRYKSISEKDIQYIFEFNSKDIYADAQNLHLNYFSSELQEDRDAHGLENILKRYEKALRVYFANYSGLKSGYHLKYFHQHNEKNSFVHSSKLYKIIVDHGLQNFITTKEVTTLARKVNYRLNKVKDDPQLLDFDGFKEFIVQMAYTMYSRPPKDLRGHPMAEVLQQLFSHLKLYSKQNLISTQLFQEPQSICFTGQSQAIKVLNKTLQQNSDYILPQGYKKITETKIIYDYKIYLEAMSVTYKQVFEVLDEILFSEFKFHIIEPFTKEQKIITARPHIYHLDRMKYAETVNIKHIPTFFKQEVAKFPIKDRITAKEAASALADIVQAIQLDHDQINLKHENPYVKGIKQKEQSLRAKREVQIRKFQNFNRQIKTTMSQYTIKKEETKQKEGEQKRKELQKKKNEKERRQKYEKELKTKLQSYNQQKKTDEEAKKASQQSKIAKQKDDAQKKKRQAEEIKKKIEQLKKQKEQEEKEKKVRDKQDQKKKKLQQKAKLQKAQKQKKQLIESYKEKKKGETKALDQSEFLNNNEGSA